MRTVFGIFMIVIYVGMGVLFLIDFFNWETSALGVAQMGGRIRPDYLRHMGGLPPVCRYRFRNIGDEY